MSYRDIVFPEDIKNTKDVPHTYYFTRQFPVKDGKVFILNPDNDDFGCLQMYEKSLQTNLLPFMCNVGGALKNGIASATSCSTGLIIDGIPYDIKYITIALKDIQMLPRIVHDEGQLVGMYDTQNITHYKNDDSNKYTMCSCDKFSKSCNCNDDSDDTLCKRHASVDSLKMSYEPLKRVTTVRVKI